MDFHLTGWSPLLSLAATVEVPAAQAILVIAIVAATGLALGSLRLHGIGLGSAGVLFSGILFGHFGWRVEPSVLEFLRDFGLILFVFCIGLQLGPGFFSALRRDGLRMNALATAVVLFGLFMALGSGWFLAIDPAATLGLACGATTNTPSLGAVQGTLLALGGGETARTALPALAYAVSYPVGILGTITAMLFLRFMLRANPEAEAESALREDASRHEPLERRNLIVENANLDGLRLEDLPGREEAHVVISRIRRAGEATAQTARSDAVVHLGDSLLAVGTASGLERFRRVVGREGDENLMEAPSDAIFQRVLVTKPEVLGKSRAELGLEALFGVVLTRVIRGETEMPFTGAIRLQFGDTVQLVGTAEQVAAASHVLGNSVKALNQTHFIPMFLGIALGVILGTRPVEIPGLPVPLKLGLAGGPLVVSILLGRLGHFGRMIWHMPGSANVAFRELGISLFLACVGLKAGPHFFSAVFTESGAVWLASAVMITFVPLLTVGLFARLFLRMNFTAIMGLIAGSTTDPPALAFAGAISKSDAPAVAYATVYPLAMLLRILGAQAITLLLWR